MPTTDQLQFEMQRRVILFNSGTTMPDNTVLGYEGNPNYAATADTPGQTLLYNSPRGTSYIELVNGNLWYKQQIPNTWINLTSGTASGTATFSSQNNVVFTTGNQNISGVKNFYSRPTVNGSGVLLVGETGSVALPNTLVYTTGNQNISGTKTFEITPIVSGNSLITGVNLSAYITTGQTGAFYPRNNPSGFITGVDLSSYITTGQTELFYPRNNPSGFITGVDLNLYALSSQVVYKTGDQIIGGNKTFSASTYFNSDINVGQNLRVTGASTFNDNLNISGNLTVAGIINNSTLVLTKGNQIISGSKTFAANILFEKDITASGNLKVSGASFIDNSLNIASNLTVRGNIINSGIVNTIGAQVISGIKTFAVAPILSGNEFITGVDLSSYIRTGQTGAFYPRSNPSGFISSADLSSYATTANLYATGSALDNKINSLSGYVNTIFAGGLLPNTIVYTSGDQIISGNKTFINNINVSGSGIFNALDLNNIDTLSLSGVDISITNGNVSLTNRPTVNGSGVVLIGELNPIIVNTGSLLNNKINILSGYVDNKDIVLSGQIASTGSILDSKINSLSGYVNAQSTSGQVFNTGSVLDNKINSLSGYVNSQDAIFSGQTSFTGSILDNKINSLSGYVDSKSIVLPTTIVYITGNQTVSGIKTFANNLEVQGTGIFNALDLSNISEFNFSGTNINLINGNVNISGGTLYISGNAVLTGVNLNAYATTANLFATGSTLDNKINSLSGYVSGISAGGLLSNTIVYTTGIQSIGGSKTFTSNAFFTNDVNVSQNLRVTGASTFNDDLNVSGNLTVAGSINNSTLVLTKGAQLISGSKTFAGNIIFEKDATITGNLRVSGASTFNNNLDVTNNLTVGGDITNSTLVLTKNNQTISGIKTFDVAPVVSGSRLITGVDLSSYITTGQTGNFYPRNNPSGFITGVDLSSYVTTGQTGNFYPRNNPSGFISSADLSSYALANQVVYRTGNQVISGIKTFADTISLNAYAGNGYDASNLDNRLNIAGNKDDNIGIQIDAYGINPPQLLMRRARGNPTRLSGVLKDDVLFNLQARGYVSGLNAYSTNSRAAIRLIASEDWVGVPNYTGQGTHILFRSTNIGAGTAIDKAVISTSGLNVLDGNIYVSGIQVLTGIDLTPYALANQTVYTIGNQVIGGQKSFTDNIIISGTENQNQTIVFGRVANNFDIRTRLTTYSGGNGLTFIGRGGVLPTQYGYGIVFEGGGISKRGYLTAGDNVTPTGYQYATLDWVNRILSGTWKADAIKIKNADPVLTATDQDISGNKTFRNLIIGPPQSSIDQTTDIRYFNNKWRLVSNNTVSSQTIDSALVNGSGLPGYGNSFYAWRFNNDLGLNYNNGILQLNNADAYGDGFGDYPNSFKYFDISVLGSGYNQYFYLDSRSGVMRLSKRPTVNGTGVLLIGEASAITLPSTIVYTTGNQLISGDKTFLNNINISGTGSFNAVKVSSIDKLFLSGIDIVITGNSSVNVYNAIYISGNPVLTGIIPSSQTLANVVYTTGNQNINGTKNFLDNIAVSGTGDFNSVKVSNIDNLFLSGIDIVVTGNSSINVYNDIYISGNKVLTGVIPSSQAITDVVYTTGNQFISGIKTFNNNVTFLPRESNQIIQLGLNNAADRGVQIFIPSGSSFSPTAFTRVGLIQGVPHGYGIVFAGGGLTNKKGYLTSSFGVSADSLIPTGYEFATLDWTNRILSGAWKTNRNIQVGDAYPVLTTGDQDISGNKTFAQTGSFATLQITNKKLSSYNYINSNFTFGDAHINIVNSSNNVIGTLPSIVTSGINYYVKNLNTGVLLITGSNQRTIDGFFNINLYKNESLQLLGVNNIGYTGWISLGVSAGVS